MLDVLLAKKKEINLYNFTYFYDFINCPAFVQRVQIVQLLTLKKTLRYKLAIE